MTYATTKAARKAIKEAIERANGHRDHGANVVTTMILASLVREGLNVIKHRGPNS